MQDHVVADPAPEFEWFAGGARGARAYPACSVTRSGSMTMNAKAVEMLGNPPAVKLGWDAAGRRVGVMAALQSEAGAIPLRTSVTAEGRATGSKSVAARTFLAFHDLLPKENNTFRLEPTGSKVLALALDDPLPRAGRIQRDDGGPTRP